jgi:hypothetical protein
MRCNKCNYDNLDGMKYCVSCGAELLTPQQKEERVKEGNRTVIILYVIIGLLVVILIGLIIFLLLGGGSTVGVKKDDAGKVQEVTHVESATIGTWACSSDQSGGELTIVIELKEDGSFRFGPINGFENNHIEGTFNSNLLGTAEAGEQYDAYELTMKQTKIITNGEVAEGEANVTYSVGVTKDGKNSIFSQGKDKTSFYCSKN